ncbi:kinesin-like protein, partial [Trifolium medium]|nr:kinesin-like protein [Trifolium medium]
AHIVLRTNILDQWLWRPDNEGGYSVRSAYKLLTAMASPDMDAMSTFLWHKQVPAKVSVLAWRLVRNRLPTTKDNLMARNIIHPDSQFCVTGCDGLETTHHLFLSCPVFAPCGAWLELGSVSLQLTRIHYRIILFSLLTRQKACELAAHLCNLYGYVAYGLC